MNVRVNSKVAVLEIAAADWGRRDDSAGKVQEKGSAFEEGKILEETNLWWRKPTAINGELKPRDRAVGTDCYIHATLGGPGILQK